MKGIGLAPQDAEVWDKAEREERQSNLRLILTQIYGDNDSSSSSGSSHDRNGGVDGHEVRTKVSLMEEDEGSGRDSESMHSSGSSAFSLADIEDDSEDCDDENDVKDVALVTNGEGDFVHGGAAAAITTGPSAYINVSYTNSSMTNLNSEHKTQINERIRYDNYLDASFANREMRGLESVHDMKQDGSRVDRTEFTTITRNDSKEEKKFAALVSPATLSQINGQPLRSHFLPPTPYGTISSLLNTNSSALLTAIQGNQTVVSSPSVDRRNDLASSSEKEVLADARMRPLEMQLHHVTAQNHALKRTLAHDRQKMEDMAVTQAEAREELLLLRTQWEQFIQRQERFSFGGANDMSSLSVSSPLQKRHASLEELRGALLHQAKSDLAAAKKETHQLCFDLQELESTCLEQHNQLVSENTALREGVHNVTRTMSFEHHNGMLPPNANQTFNALKERSQKREEHLLTKLSTAEKNATDLRLRLEQTEQIRQNELQTLNTLEKDHDEWKQKAQDCVRETECTKDKLKGLRKERDVLRNEVNELMESRGGHAERILERKFQLEIENMRSVAEQIKAEAEQVKAEAVQKAAEAERIELQGRQALEQARHVEAERNVEAEELRESVETLLMQLLRMEDVGLFNGRLISAKHLACAAVGDNGAQIVSRLASDRSLWRPEIFDLIVDKIERHFVDEGSQTQNEPKIVTGVQTIETLTCTVGTNTNETFIGFQAAVEAEGNVMRNDIKKYQELISKLKVENANLCGSNEHMEEQVVRYRKRMQALNLSEEACSSPSGSQSPAKLAEELCRMARVCNDLKTTNAQILQENEILLEGKAAVEGENSRILERGIELEKLAEEATQECERLSNEIHDAHSSLHQLQSEKSQVDDQLEMLREEGKQRADKEETKAAKNLEDLTKSYTKLQLEYESALEAKKTIKGELNTLLEKNLQLEAANEILSDKGSDFSSLAAQLQQKLHDMTEGKSEAEQKVQKIMDEIHGITDSKTKLLNQMRINEERVSLLQNSNDVLAKSKAELEDELSRARNVNILIKSKVQATEDEIALIRKSHECALQEKSKLATTVSELQSDSVTLAKAKTDSEVECSRLQNENVDLKKSMAIYEDKIHALNRELKSASTISLTQQRQIDTMQEELASISASNSVIESERSRLREQLSIMEFKIAAYEKTLNDEKKHVESLDAKNRSLDELVQSLRSKLEELRKDYANSENECTHWRNQHSSKVSNIAITESRLHELERSIKTLTAEKTELENLVCSSKAELHHLTMSKTKSDDVLTCLKNDNTELVTEISSLKLKLSNALAPKSAESFNAEKIELERLIRSGKSELQNLSTSKANSDKARACLEKDNEAIVAELETLRSEMCKSQTESDKERNVLMEENSRILAEIESLTSKISNLKAEFEVERTHLKHENKSILTEVESLTLEVSNVKSASNEQLVRLREENALLEKQVKSLTLESRPSDDKLVERFSGRLNEKTSDSALNGKLQHFLTNGKHLASSFRVQTCNTASNVRMPSPPVRYLDDNTYCSIVTGDSRFRVKTTVYGNLSTSKENHHAAGHNMSQLFATPGEHLINDSVRELSTGGNSANTVSWRNKLNSIQQESSSSKQDLSAVRSSLFVGNAEPTEAVTNSSFAPSERILNCRGFASSNSDVYLDEKLRRCKIAAQRAAVSAKKSMESTETHGGRSTSVCRSSIKKPLLPALPVENSLQDTELFVANVLKSCGKRDFTFVAR